MAGGLGGKMGWIRLAAGGDTPLHWAAGGGHVAVAQLLVETGAPLDSKDNVGRGPRWEVLGWIGFLAEEVTSQNIGAQFLFTMRLRSNPKHQQTQQLQCDTPLHYAAEKGHVAVAQLLVEAGAPLDSQNNSRSAMHYAAEKGHAEVLSALAAAGGQVEKATGDNGLGREPRELRSDTPLHYAAEKGHVAVAQLLVEAWTHRTTVAGASEGRWAGFVCNTPLHLAAEKGHVEAAQLLVEAGAPLESKDNSGRTPLDVAKAKGKTDVVKLLEAKLQGFQRVQLAAATCSVQIVSPSANGLLTAHCCSC
eukprot:Skav225252  [mRNA]  locus=scaffold988:75501:80213:- [translate_table: standard]